MVTKVRGLKVLHKRLHVRTRKGPERVYDGLDAVVLAVGRASIRPAGDLTTGSSAAQLTVGDASAVGSIREAVVGARRAVIDLVEKRNRS